MFVKVSTPELLHQKRLPFDLYTITGERLFLTGHTFSQAELAELSKMSLYRHERDIPVDWLAGQDYINHEGHLFYLGAGLTGEDAQSLVDEMAATSIYDTTIYDTAQSLQFFWERIRKGATPDIALCEVVRDQLIAEVTCKVDEIKYLSQIRVRDEFTYSHILDVTALSIALAIKAGFSKTEVKEIGLAAILHDLGKLMIPKEIMFKPSRLTEKEFQVMKLHPELGYRAILGQLNLPEQIARPALEHQEMYGGGGYPQNLSGNAIHSYSHVVKIADVYDALTSKRPYKESIPSAKAVKIMLSEGDKSFHPEFLAHFVKLCNFKEPTHLSSKAS